jgi:hypothetical protein
MRWGLQARGNGTVKIHAPGTIETITRDRLCGRGCTAGSGGTIDTVLAGGAGSTHISAAAIVRTIGPRRTGIGIIGIARCVNAAHRHQQQYQHHPGEGQRQGLHPRTRSSRSLHC